jgi:hypothetical protein
VSPEVTESKVKSIDSFSFKEMLAASFFNFFFRSRCFATYNIKNCCFPPEWASNISYLTAEETPWFMHPLAVHTHVMHAPIVHSMPVMLLELASHLESIVAH